MTMRAELKKPEELKKSPHNRGRAALQRRVSMPK